MNDLETIQRKNAQAIVENIPQLLAKGHFVVVEYAGLHVVGCENFSGEGAEQHARAKLQELNSSGTSSHGELHHPPLDYVGEIRTAGADPSPVNNDHLAQRFGIAA